MGASEFVNVAKGKTPKEAFRSAVDQARYDHGHAGYTGTLAEKGEFVLISNKRAETVKEACALAEQLIDAGDERIDDKWGPAGCIRVGDSDTYVFFGWASS
jgi:hypothetical protein